MNNNKTETDKILKSYGVSKLKQFNLADFNRIFTLFCQDFVADKLSFANFSQACRDLIPFLSQEIIGQSAIGFNIKSYCDATNDEDGKIKQDVAENLVEQEVEKLYQSLGVDDIEKVTLTDVDILFPKLAKLFIQDKISFPVFITSCNWLFTPGYDAVINSSKYEYYISLVGDSLEPDKDSIKEDMIELFGKD